MRIETPSKPFLFGHCDAARRAANHVSLEAVSHPHPESGDTRPEKEKPCDEQNLTYQFEVYDALYAWCRLQACRLQVAKEK
jgi:hypothetical protein